jgi:CHAD domain-containing protein
MDPVPALSAPPPPAAALGPPPARPPSHGSGLGWWMRRVRRLAVLCRASLDEDPVHDLRTALRRCRTMASGVGKFDPEPDWDRMDRAAKAVFRVLGDLRDVQVMAGWIRAMSPPGDASGAAMLERLAAREAEERVRAAEALGAFDLEGWRGWSRTLPGRARRVPRKTLAFSQLAIEAWEVVRAAKEKALESRAAVDLHRLRIGVKRFRYGVENFLPAIHKACGDTMKRMQDLLGEIHDLDLLWHALMETGVLTTRTVEHRWFSRVDRASRERLREVMRMDAGRGSVWGTWRTLLPEGRRAREASLARFEAWAAFRDPDIGHARRVRKISVWMFTALGRAGLPGPFADERARRILEAAALMHDAGRSRAIQGHHKTAFKNIRKIDPPSGWTETDLAIAALVARYHRGALPREDHPGFADLALPDRDMVICLSGILRLADAFDGHHDGAVTGVKVEAFPQAILVRAMGYEEAGTLSAIVAAKKTLLESVYNRPVIVSRDAAE